MAFITGQVVRGKNFFDRKYELEDIWEAVENGEHTLLVAPRRVGKTSIMHKMLDEPKDGYVVLYMDYEEDNFEHQFWARMFKSLKQGGKADWSTLSFYQFIVCKLVNNRIHEDPGTRTQEVDFQ